VALVTALVVVAVVTTLAASVGLSQQVWLRQVQNQQDRVQAALVEYAALNWALTVIDRDTKNSNVSDNLAEDWAVSVSPIPVEGGLVRGSIADAQGRFNLNNLLRGDTPSAVDIAVFRRLLQELEIDPNVTEAVLDWIDADSVARPGGADDMDYLRMNPPYRAANQLFSSVEELRMVAGFDKLTVDTLTPFVVALPVATAININTAPVEVLSAVFDLPVEQLKKLVDERTAKPLKSASDLQAYLPSKQTVLPPGLIDFRSDFFIVDVQSSFGQLLRASRALVQRASDHATILWQAQLS
jgi:general secretion pathway protein K